MGNANGGTSTGGFSDLRDPYSSTHYRDLDLDSAMRKGAFMTETKKTGAHVRALHIKASFVAIVVIFLLTLAGFAYLLNDVIELSNKTADLTKATARLTRANTNHIAMIQQSRVSSCRKTYNSIHEVFEPFFPKKPRTRAQQELIDRFDHRVHLLVMGCTKQTAPHQ